MQLKKRKAIRQIGGPLAAATCTLLGHAAPREVSAQELAPWDIDTSMLIYSESDSRVKDFSINLNARKEVREERFLNLKLETDPDEPVCPSAIRCSHAINAAGWPGTAGRMRYSGRVSSSRHAAATLGR